jgi:putative hydrolase of the HAD superfamily
LHELLKLGLKRWGSFCTATEDGVEDMTARLTTIGFDADDTLWQNEQFFRLTEDRFVELLSAHADGGHLRERLLEAEKRNLGHYGFGIKGFTLSMIETAVEVTDGQVPASIIGELLAAGREMLRHPVETLPHARETLETLAGDYRLVLITKGDLFDQERKLAQSGLGDFFHAVEIVSDKRAETYRAVFARHGDGATRAMMVGNSLKSDVVPAIEAGSWGIYVPHDLTWVLEHVDEPAGHPRYRRIGDLGALKGLIGEFEHGKPTADDIPRSL